MPIKATGTISTCALSARKKAPGRNGLISPSGVRPPSGKITSGIPAFKLFTAERIAAIQALEIPLLERAGSLHITASAGAASSSEGDKDGLIAAADGALYVAKREGKNRTMKAESRTANVVGGE